MHNAAHELAAYGLGRIKPENLRITLIEAGPRVLPALPERIGGPVHTTLEKLGVTVLTNAAVSEVTADSLITASGQVIPATLKVWAAGIRAPVFLHELDGLESNRINQLQPVGARLARESGASLYQTHRVIFVRGQAWLQRTDLQIKGVIGSG